MARTPNRTAQALIVAAMAVAGTLLVATTASARTKHFQPVDKLAHAMVFEPRGVEPTSIRRAYVEFRDRRGHRVRRRVSRASVRQTLVANSRLQLRSPARASKGRLSVTVKPTPPTATSCEFGTFTAFTTPGACWRPYSDASPFNRALPSSPAIAPDSAAAVNRWLGYWNAPGAGGYSPRFSVGTADTPEDWEHPLYYSQPTDPVYTVHCAENWGTCEIEGMEVRIPSAARAAGGDDGHMAVIDQASGWEYDFWQVRDKPSAGGTITISWGGRTRTDGDGLDSNGTAAYFGGVAGIIRPAELAAGEINHALFMAVKCTNGKSVAPAGAGAGRSCSELGLSNAGAPPMGAHFFLDMSASEIVASGAPAWKQTIMRAMARYGMFVGDTGGGFIKIESGSSFTSFGQADPWVQIAKDAGLPAWRNPATGKAQYRFDLTQGVDWANRLKMAAPCVSQGGC